MVNDGASLDETLLTSALRITFRTLIIHDNAVLAGALQLDLQHAGYAADFTDDTTAALASLHANFSPVVIIDLGQTGDRGLGLCREIRARKYPGYVYIFLRAHRQGEEAAIEGYEAGADEYLSTESSAAFLIARLGAVQRILSHERNLKHLLSERRKMSFTDPLTSAFNRRYFLKYGQRALKQARDERHPSALLLLDLDHFKTINDRFGHDMGDLVLVVVRTPNSPAVKRVRMVFARGREEFAVFLPNTDPPRAKRVAERIRTAVAAEPFVSGRLIIAVTVSVGAASPLEGMSIEELMRRADKALYRSKRAGRNKSTVLSRRAERSRTLPEGYAGDTEAQTMLCW